ncbi:leucyl aminopeptidase [Desulfobacteraceae bacterium SEEP-SAG9]|nr:leucyl aminopeptidase [Desulfobacteraceae bacterium SEEP-SAG9]
MVLQLIAADLKKEKTETLIIPVCEDKDIHDNQAISALIKLTREIKEFRGRPDDELILHNLPDVGSKRVIFMGLGKLAKVDREALRVVAGRAVKKCIQQDISEVMIAVPCSKKIKLEMLSILEPMMEGACLGNHRFDKYKKEKKHTPLKKIKLLVKPDIMETFKKLPSRMMSICDGTILARDWVSMPPNDKTPEQFAQSIVSLFRKCNIDVRVLEEKELKQKKFGSILAVAAGSQSKPRMVIGVYNPDGAKKTVALVGKGVTFDSGGINLKSTASLEDMKMDMSGAAAVAATLIVVAKLKPKIKVVGIIPIVENMPSGNAARPGDIIKSYDGKTIEIGNTDAEGRLILIDGMSYAIREYNPQTLIDLATLTGSCVVALGEKIAGIFSFDDELAEAIVQSGVKTHERCWRMPLPEDYKETLKSDFADIKNISSSRWGGAITAALFLSEFVADTRWAHIDIAGPAYLKKENAYCGPGGTGFGVRLLCDLLEKL